MSKTVEQYLKEIEAAKEGWKGVDHKVRRKIYSTRTLVGCDVHAPYFDDKLLAMLRYCIGFYNIQTVLWLGDFFDMHMFSHWGQTDYSLSWPQEKQICENVITQIARDLRKTGGQQFFSRGNHDDRWIKKQDGKENMRGLLSSIGPEVGRLMADGEIDFTDGAMVEFNPDSSGNMTWLGVHPGQYKRNPLQTASEFAAMYNMNVISAHEHHMAWGSSPDGKYHVVDGGGLFAEPYLEYVHSRPTAGRRMTPGFWVIVEDFNPLPITPKQGNRFMTVAEREAKDATQEVVTLKLPARLDIA